MQLLEIFQTILIWRFFCLASRVPSVLIVYTLFFHGNIHSTHLFFMCPLNFLPLISFVLKLHEQYRIGWIKLIVMLKLIKLINGKIISNFFQNYWESSAEVFWLTTMGKWFWLSMSLCGFVYSLVYFILFYLVCCCYFELIAHWN